MRGRKHRVTSFMNDLQMVKTKKITCSLRASFLRWFWEKNSGIWNLDEPRSFSENLIYVSIIIWLLHLKGDSHEFLQAFNLLQVEHWDKRALIIIKGELSSDVDNFSRGALKTTVMSIKSQIKLIFFWLANLNTLWHEI